MAKLCYSVACSLDGFIAAAQGEVDWISLDPEVDFAVLWARFDTLLMGRRTYEAAVKRFGDAGFQGKREVVASRSWNGDDLSGVMVLPSVDAATLQRVRAEAAGDIWLMGGGELFGSLLEAGEVDQVEVMIVPVLLGSGVPLVARLAKRAELVLREHTVFASGLAWMRYDVKRV